jgi:hypothetical protein
MKKLVFALVVVAALLVVAMPVAAQGPRPVFVRAVGTNEDPFGGLPIGGTQYPGSSKYNVGGITGLGQLNNGTGDVAVSGGVPSDKSGDGTAIRKAIYIGGAWANQAQNVKGFGLSAGETPMEIPSCVTVKIPAGQGRWFKMDTWKEAASAGSSVPKEPLFLQVWVDDELDGATKPSGSAVWGAASQYAFGVQAWDGWSKNLDAAGDNTSYGGARAGAGNWNGISGPHAEGFLMTMYSPNMLQPNFAYPAPNAWLYTVNSSSTGLSRSGPVPPPEGVAPSFECQMNNNSAGALMSKCNTIIGYGQYNPSQPSHLLWYETRSDGWWHALVTNRMIWDGTASVCSYRSIH